MSYSTSLYASLNRFQVQGTAATLTAGAGETIYLSIFGVPNEFEINRLRIIENGNITLAPADSIDIKVLSDPGKYREAEAIDVGSGESYVLLSIDNTVSEVSPNIYWLYDDIFDPPIRIFDNLKSNCFHIQISSDAALSAAAEFSVYVEGYKISMAYTTTHDIRQARHNNRFLRVLRHDVASDLWYRLGDTTNPDYNKDYAISPFVLNTDYVYFGMEEKWNGLWFNINDKNTTTGITETWEYWDGAAWNALTVRNNCTDAETTNPTSFYNSSIIEWDTPVDWNIDTIDSAAMVTTEPPYDFLNGNIYKDKWQPKYWLRVNIDNVTTPPTFYWIREIEV